jgi:hypothetical protein
VFLVSGGILLELQLAPLEFLTALPQLQQLLVQCALQDIITISIQLTLFPANKDLLLAFVLFLWEHAKLANQAIS